MELNVLLKHMTSQSFLEEIKNNFCAFTVDIKDLEVLSYEIQLETTKLHF